MQGIKRTNHNKINKLEFTKFKNICSSYETYENERQATDWDSIFLINISDKKFVSRIHFFKKSVTTQ